MAQIQSDVHAMANWQLSNRQMAVVERVNLNMFLNFLGQILLWCKTFCSSSARISFKLRDQVPL